MNKFAVTAYLGVLVLGCGAFVAQARPEYARSTSKPCGYCHTRATGGGARNFRGMFYGANGLSFSRYNEKREALIAAVAADSEGVNSNPNVRYIANVAGPAVQQIQLASLRGPVVLVFINLDGDVAKKPLEQLADLSKAYGNQVSFMAIVKGNPDTALSLTDKMGSRLRIMPDEDGAAAKKFGATNGLDLCLVAKQGDPIKTFSGFSKEHIEALIKLLEESQEVAAPTFDLSKLPQENIKGAKLSGSK